jgi:hypothetical protein
LETPTLATYQGEPPSSVLPTGISLKASFPSAPLEGLTLAKLYEGSKWVGGRREGRRSIREKLGKSRKAFFCPPDKPHQIQLSLTNLLEPLLAPPKRKQKFAKLDEAQ